MRQIVLEAPGPKSPRCVSTCKERVATAFSIRSWIGRDIIHISTMNSLATYTETEILDRNVNRFAWVRAIILCELGFSEIQGRSLFCERQTIGGIK